MGFDDVYSFIGFTTSILYNLVPCAFFFQLKHKALKKERISIIPLLCLYSNATIYFVLSAFQVEDVKSINPMDFCNLVGAYLGFVYLIIYIIMVYLKEEKTIAIFYIMILVIITLLFLILAWNVIREKISFWINLFKYMGIVFNIFQNLPMGFSIIYLVKNKVSEKYTLFGAFFGLLNVLSWLVWGLQAVFIDTKNENKPYQTVIANLIALFLPIMQFYLYYKYKKDDEEISNSLEIDTNNLEPLSINIRESNNQEMPKNRQTEEFDDFI
jgi:hypothetical protein